MNNTSLGDRIKYHRKKLGMTQEQLAQRMGVSTQAVSKWENNLSCPDISILPELAEVFGISIDELLGRETSGRVFTAKEAEVVDEETNKELHHKWKLEKKKGGIIFALFILTIGTLLLLRGIVPAMNISVWTILWTTALIYIGISGMIGHFTLFSTVMTLAGTYFLLSAYQVFGWPLRWSYVIPAVILLWGVCLLIDVLVGKRFRRKKKVTHGDKKLHHEYGCENGYLHCELSFGECRAAVVTPMLRGGSIDSSFGDFTVDFSACESIQPGCTIDVDNSFGNLTLLIPDRFAVSLEQDSSFASAPEIKGNPAQETMGTLHIKADLSFGAMEIRYI